MSTMGLIDVCLAVYAPRCTASIAARPLGWASGSHCYCSRRPCPAAQLTLTWDASPVCRSSGVSSVLRYRELHVYCQHRRRDGHYLHHNRAAPGQTYYFAVTAYDRSAEAESAFADEVSITLPLPEEPAPEELITLPLQRNQRQRGS